MHSWGLSVEAAFEQQVVAIMGIITELDTINISLHDTCTTTTTSSSSSSSLAGAASGAASGGGWPACAREVAAEGHDLPSLLFNFLDEWLFQFNAEARCSPPLPLPLTHSSKVPSLTFLRSLYSSRSLSFLLSCSSVCVLVPSHAPATLLPRSSGSLRLCVCRPRLQMFVCRRVKVLSLDREHWRITSVGVGETFELGRHPQGTEVKAITYSAMRITEEAGRVDVLVIVDI